MSPKAYNKYCSTNVKQLLRSALLSAAPGRLSAKPGHCTLLLCALLLACPEEPASSDYFVPTSSTCGDNNRQGKERCDGDDLNEKSCDDLGFGAGSLRCKPSCRDFDRTFCGAPPDCGDGVAAGVELCDGADLDGETCESLGLGAGTLACASNCGEFDTALCGPPPDCGDGEKNGSAELCDGEDFGRLTCQRLGYSGGELVCLENCQRISQAGCFHDCTPDCSGRLCGPDPVCGLSCGQCDGGVCNNSGQCVGSTDAGLVDSARRDSGPWDFGLADSSPQDLGLPDSSPQDLGLWDSATHLPDAADGGPVPVEGELLLATGTSHSGRLLVRHNGGWGTVCDDGWTQAAADVACRQMFGLNYTGTFSSNETDPDGCAPGYDPIWLDDISCTGTESRLIDCGHSQFGVHNCTHNEDVCLTCVSN